MSTKANVLLVGSGGVGTMAAYALETGGLAEVTVVLRSNFAAVQKNGYYIDSLDHGNGIEGWRPSHIRNTVPDVSKESSLKPFDYIVVTTKNVPDVKPTVVDIVESAVTPGHTAILLLQNGINIERPLISRFPNNTIMSGVSLIGATEVSHGRIRHDDNDVMKLGAYKSPGVSAEASEETAKRFIEIYSACGKVDCQYNPDVSFTRWRKLIYNASFNAVSTILQMDTSRMRMYEHIIDDLIRPIMLEIKSIALADAVQLPEDLIDTMIRIDPADTFFKPSMCQDYEKGNLMEIENIVGEPVREAERLGVSAPTLKIIYGLLKGLQAKVKEARGLLVPTFTETSRYQ